ncbi:hypothetical protein DFH09DRAFT_1027747 [Mycena vulgaris]|nr:hypothetical protein DFH09DRAFT_1027747 [Mycena vulgaris]
MLRRIVREKKGILARARRYISAAPASTDGLRAQPWAFKDIPGDTIQKTQLRSNVARFNVDIAAKADKGQFPTCFALAADMKTQGVSPDITTYNTLLRALAHGGYSTATLAVLEDMLSVGISPNTASFNHIIHAYRTETTALLPVILRRMEELGVAPNATTYTHLITRFVSDRNLEVALQHLHAMHAHNFLPEVAAAQAIIVLAAEQGYPKLAVDLATSFESEGLRKVEDSVWLACLRSSAADLYAEGVQKCWGTLVTNLAISPDEGLCTLVLHTAARHGLFQLATDVLRVLQVLEIPWGEHHLASLFEAFCRAQNFEGALTTLSLMRTSDMNPTVQSTFPLTHAVRQNPDILPDLWTNLAQAKKAGHPVDLSAFNGLLHASVSTQPLSRALADYNTLKLYGFTPNAETFHTFIDGCLSAGNIAYGELAFRQLKEAGAVMDHDVFGKMIALHLTQDTYDDAFLYLEDMQSAGHVPEQHLYEAIVLKCAAVQDPRYLVALEEMKDVGHSINPDFMRAVRRLTERKHAAEEEVVPKDPSIFGRVGIDAQKFIETGGLSGMGTEMGAEK